MKLPRRLATRSRSRFRCVQEALTLTGGISRLEAASMLHIGIDHFSHCFRREQGVCFRQWRSQVIAWLAKQALITERGLLRIKELAARLGYATQSAFSRMFRRAYGCCPTAGARSIASPLRR